jgi:hypothetical protein
MGGVGTNERPFRIGLFVYPIQGKTLLMDVTHISTRTLRPQHSLLVFFSFCEENEQNQPIGFWLVLLFFAGKYKENIACVFFV